MTADSHTYRRTRTRAAARLFLTLAALVVGAIMVWQAIAAGGDPDPLAAGASGARVLDIGVLVFREGLECILVLAAIMASMVGSSRAYRRPVTVGAATGFVATLITWQIAVGIISSLTDSIPALDVQAITGLLAILVLLLVMNWFFHKIYWTGWISVHTQRKRTLLARAGEPGVSRLQILLGLGVLGFTSMYREGFEVVLFLQNYRLKLGPSLVLQGVLAGLGLTAIVAVLTFVANRRLPYRKMLVLTGVLLGIVLLVMVGEQAQEMQLAGWISTTPIPWLTHVIPAWLGMWFAVFPTVETLAAQLIAAALVLGSYWMVRSQFLRLSARAEAVSG